MKDILDNPNKIDMEDSKDKIRVEKVDSNLIGKEECIDSEFDSGWLNFCIHITNTSIIKYVYRPFLII